MMDKYRKNTTTFQADSNLFLTGIINKTKKIFTVTNGLANAKYGLVNGILYQIIRVINLNEIEKQDEINNLSQWVNVKLKTQNENRQIKHFSYEFLTKLRGDFKY